MEAAIEQDIRELGIRTKRQLELFPHADSNDPAVIDELRENSIASSALNLKIAEALNITPVVGESALELLMKIVDRCQTEGSDAADDLMECLPILVGIVEELPTDACPTPQGVAAASRKFQPTGP